MWCILETLTFGDILVVKGRKSHLMLVFRTFQMTSGLWHTKRSLRLWSVISQHFPVLGRRTQSVWLRLDVLIVAHMKEWQESALQHRLHKSFFKGEISCQVKPKKTNVKCIKSFKALNLFRVPNVRLILLILRARWNWTWIKKLNRYKFSEFGQTKAGMGQHSSGSCNGRNKARGTSVPSHYSDVVQIMVPLKERKL